MINDVECFAKIYYNKIGLFAVFQVIKIFLSDAEKLVFTAAFRKKKNMLEWAENVWVKMVHNIGD